MMYSSPFSYCGLITLTSGWWFKMQQPKHPPSRWLSTGKQSVVLLLRKPPPLFQIWDKQGGGFLINSIWGQKIFACGGLKNHRFLRFWSVSNTPQTCKFVVFDRISKVKIPKIFSPAASYDNTLLNTPNLSLTSSCKYPIGNVVATVWLEARRRRKILRISSV